MLGPRIAEGVKAGPAKGRETASYWKGASHHSYRDKGQSCDEHGWWVDQEAGCLMENTRRTLLLRPESIVSSNSVHKTPELSGLGPQIFVSCPSSCSGWVTRDSAHHSHLRCRLIHRHSLEHCRSPCQGKRELRNVSYWLANAPSGEGHT